MLQESMSVVISKPPLLWKDIVLSKLISRGRCVTMESLYQLFDFEVLPPSC